MSIINEKDYYTVNETEEKSLIKESSELQVQSLYQLLLKNPYLVNVVDNKNETMLSYSIKNNNISISNLILTSPIIDLDYQDKNGNTYLHLAVMFQQKEIMNLLIEKGISINRQNKKGNTALHIAYIVNNKQIIKVLIDNGIDKNILNQENKLAEDLMIKNKRTNSSLNNRIKVTKNKELNKKKDTNDTIGKNFNNKKKDNSVINNNTNINRNKNNKSITSSNSKLKMKVKAMSSKEIKKNNNKIQNINLYNDDIEETYNNNYINGNINPKKKNNINDDDTVK
jgi:ankyrin repeat protein